MSASPSLPIKRNTALLSGSLAMNSATLQLAAAVASLTLVRVLDIKGLLGLGPAITLGSGALAALPAGLLMDRFGRVPVLAIGFAAGIVGCALAALGTAQESAPAVLVGLMLVGASSSTALLARTAAGDMYPAERRARGIALVLFGSVFGAILGPAVFGPVLAGRDLDGDALSTLWLIGGGFMLAGLAIVLTVRPDPKRIAELLATRDDGEDEAAHAQEVPPAAPIRELIRRPGVIPALLAAQASFAVMVAVMTLTGAVVVDHHHHEASNVFPIIGAHVIGMFGLIIVVGDLVDRVGRTPALAGGLLLMGASTISLLWITSVPASVVALFGLGLGWNFSFVAATAVLSDSTAPHERGKLLGFNDLLAGLTGAGLALLGGLALDVLGVASLAIGGAVLVAAPALWILRSDPVAAAATRS
ncbi:MAG TPA: MFS transporter [Solirubrobacteraceae bacterium]|nr:MFS transporter [Solirubrobacteraceae bacterium]